MQQWSKEKFDEFQNTIENMTPDELFDFVSATYKRLSLAKKSGIISK